MRYSASFLAASVISFFLFLGMSILITNKNTYQSNDFEAPNFSMINEMETPLKVKTIKPKIPEQKKVKHPPAKPHIEIKNNPTRPPISVTSIKSDFKNMAFTTIDIPTLKTGNAEQPNLLKNGDINCIVCIQPNYPHAPARAGIEGWVKVEFIVNSSGTVTDAKIIDSHPKRTFDQATLRAIYKSKFKPMVIDGKAMAQTAIQIIEFKLEK